MSEDESAEVISFEKAGDPHVQARKEEKLKKVQKAFKAATREKLKADRKVRRKRSSKKRKKKR